MNIPVQTDSFFERFFRQNFFYFDRYPLVIKIAVLLTLIAVITILVAYSSILLRRFAAYLREKRLHAIHPHIDELLTEYVLLNEDAMMQVPVEEVRLQTEVFLSRQFRKRWQKQALIDRMIHFKKNVTGDISMLLTRVYVETGLDKFSMSKLKKMGWSSKVIGIVELTSMDMTIADVTILPLTNSRNRTLRAEARNAYIKLSKNDPFKFFDVTMEPLLMWDQLELFRTITTTEGLSIPNFARWISYSTNKSIVAFCLKLALHYNQREAIPSIIHLLNTRDHYLRADTINCLGKFMAEDAEEKLVHMYFNQPVNCQIEILKALGRIATGNHLDFLKNEFLRSTDFELRKNAAKSIIRHQALATQMIQELLSNATTENALILKHCMNPLIKY
ncbi:MAG: HEAT repeat domain-containing protein [Sediminibacterium magnilacihabitans]|jgi:hypothetical protein|nr:HEAT repeat domain-containing protein [Sediminibacterium magnilacihabitans]